MRRRTFTMTMMLFIALCITAAGRRTTFTVDVNRPFDAPATHFAVNTKMLAAAYGLADSKAIDSKMMAGILMLVATYNTSSGKEGFYSQRTIESGFGHWFAASGMATSKTDKRAIRVEYSEGIFLISHNTAANVSEGDRFTVKESFICTEQTDTLTYVFNITVGGTDKTVSSNEGKVAFGRPDYTGSWIVTPQVKENQQTWENRNYIQVTAGNDVTLSATPGAQVGTAHYSWLNSKGKTIRSYKTFPEFTLSNLTPDDGGMYTLKIRFAHTDGSVEVKEYHYFVDVQANQGEPYDWTQHTATFSYDFRDEYPQLEEPQKVHQFFKRTANGKTAPANQYVGKWWSAFWGDDLNPEVGTDSATIYAAAKHMVDYFDQEFAYLRDRMGWPPDLSARSGYKSIIYIFGSGLTNDNAAPDVMGGYQSATQADGATWACVWSSYYPFSRFRTDKDFGDNQWQMDALVHEGIHATLADMPGVKGSSWFHEAGNTWAQSKMGQLKAQDAGITVESDDAQAGWLDGGPFLAPFMPIECYSGWLQDGSFGGPQAQGVNRYNEEGKQICTWRNILGGTQYGNSFPTILSAFCGIGSVPWIWRYCDYRVLEGIGDYIGEDAMRLLILQYRARMAIYDFGYGSKSYRNVTSNQFGNAIGPEYEPYWIDCGKWRMTPYACPVPNDNNGWLAPDTLTNPGWSGANFIPIHVDPKASKAVVEFRPEDTHMMAQLCYRTKDGTSYYSQPVYCGKMEIDLTDRPANEVIICVVANTDYIFDDKNGDAQRAHHWDYRIRLGDGAWAVADNYQKWFFHERTITDPTFDPTGISPLSISPSMGRRYDGLYNLQGQRISRLQKGLNIVDGKKIMVK